MSALNKQSWSGPLGTLNGRRLALLVSGGVAAYKAAELARLFVKAGAEVRVIMTENATRFIAPLTFESLTGQPAVSNMWARPQFDIEHISWTKWAEAVIIAPATANFMAKLAWGLADDFASSFMLAFNGPKILAPAMNSQMWANQATQDNLGTLTQRGFKIADPEGGILACGDVGCGRLADLNNIALITAQALTPPDLAGHTIAVSAGSTIEAWDDIRFLSNRSTGQMGLALAYGAWLRGAEVNLVAGASVPISYKNLPRFTTFAVQSTRDMLSTLENLDFQALIMAAAPADFRPVNLVSGKIKKDQGTPKLELTPNPDILKSLNKKDRIFVGFAAEDNQLKSRAVEKLKNKNLDMIVANQTSAFAAANNQLWLIFPDGRVDEISERPKFAAAWAVLDSLFELLTKTNLKPLAALDGTHIIN